MRLDFLLEAVGPGTERLEALPLGAGLTSPSLGRPPPLRRPSRAAAGAILVGGGIESRRWRFYNESSPSGRSHSRSCSAFAIVPTRGLDLFRCSEVRTASEDGHTGHQGYVTDLLAVLLEGDDAGSAVVYACRPPMLEAVRDLCAARAVPAELALETPMACGFGSCLGCAVPLRDGGYMRLCVDGPVVRCAEEIETAMVAGSGH